MKGPTLCLLLALSLSVTAMNHPSSGQSFPSNHHSGVRKSSSAQSSSPSALSWLGSLFTSSHELDEEEFRKQSNEQMQAALARHYARMGALSSGAAPSGAAPSGDEELSLRKLARDTRLSLREMTEEEATGMTVIVQALTCAATEIQMGQYDVLASIIGGLLFVSNPTFVFLIPNVVSGVIEDSLPDWVQSAADTLIGDGDTVVITVNWNNVVPPGSSLNYYDLVIYALAVARELAVLFLDVNAHLAADGQSMPAGSVQIVGHGIGAQIAGMFGDMVEGVGTITGLDPAGPYFMDPERDPSEFLNSASANFVEIIHTNGGSIASGALSFFDAVGDVDYYVNGGTEQPGCEVDLFTGVGNVISNLLTGDFAENTCATDRAPEIFLEVITSDTAVAAYSCANYETFSNGECLRNVQSVLGMDAASNVPGQYYLNTFSESPFLGDALEVAVETATTVGNIALELSVAGPDGFELTIPNIVDEGDIGQSEILAMVLAPLGTDLESLDFSVEYHKPRWCFWCPDSLEIQQILVTRTVTDTFSSVFAYFECGWWLLTDFNALLYLVGFSPCNGLGE